MKTGVSSRSLVCSRWWTFDEDLARRIDAEYRPGVLVRSVRRDSVAHAAGVSSGYIITDVMGVNVESVDDLVDELNEYDLTEGVRLSVTDGKNGTVRVLGAVRRLKNTGQNRTTQSKAVCYGSSWHATFDCIEVSLGTTGCYFTPRCSPPRNRRHQG